MKEKRLSLPPLAKGLSARLLVLTIGFVMLAEVLIYTPSIGRFRLSYLEEKLASSHLAVLAVEATPDQMVSPELERELLSHVQAESIALTKPNAGKLMLMTDMPLMVDETIDLRERGFFHLIGDALAVLASDGKRQIRVKGDSPKDPRIMVEVVLAEGPLRAAMLDFSWRILGLSLVISGMTAALVFLALAWIMVRPMRRLTESMIAFSDDPEDAHHVIRWRGRSDEIGVAQRELANLQETLRSMLTQKTRLAALGIAVSKITHDLKNILATARLVSDRLSDSADPEVRKAAPTLLRAIDRAVHLCLQTLDFAKEGPSKPQLEPVCLKHLLDEVGEALVAEARERRWDNRLPDSYLLEGDQAQLFRVFHNLARNAYEAGAREVTLEASLTGDWLALEISDDGPGLSERARKHLFQPFEGSAKPGGTGLGLAIARELVRAHGGRIELLDSDARGTRFCLRFPASSLASKQKPVAVA